MHSFTAGDYDSSGQYTNSDGASPQAGLVLWGSTLYGTAPEGGSSGNGAVFAVNIDGTGFTNLHSFTAGDYDASNQYTNSDGANPVAGVMLSGNTLYGSSLYGGDSGHGTVFAVNTDGTGFMNLHSFTAIQYDSSGQYTNSDGSYPQAGLILSDDLLYGTATSGGNWGNGTVFSVSLPGPRLTIIPSRDKFILSWPTNAAGFTLQSTTNLDLPAVWNTNYPAPTIVNGQNTVTNPISGDQQYYRLSK
jgi:uncharacterized repeat protein (TIGR03803 family)